MYKYQHRERERERQKGEIEIQTGYMHDIFVYTLNTIACIYTSVILCVRICRGYVTIDYVAACFHELYAKHLMTLK